MLKLLLHLKLLGMSLYVGPDLDAQDEKERRQERDERLMNFLDQLVPTLAELILSSLGLRREPAPTATPPDLAEMPPPPSVFTNAWLSWCKLVETSLEKRLILPQIPTAPLTSLAPALLEMVLVRLVEHVNESTITSLRFYSLAKDYGAWAPHALEAIHQQVPIPLLPIDDAFENTDAARTMYSVLSKLIEAHNRGLNEHEREPSASAA